MLSVRQKHSLLKQVSATKKHYIQQLNYYIHEFSIQIQIQVILELGRDMANNNRLITHFLNTHEITLML